MTLALLRDDDFGSPSQAGWNLGRRGASALTRPLINPPSSNAATTNQQDRSATRTWYKPLLEGLKEVSVLKADWAGPGTIPPDPQALLAAMFLMTTVAQPATKAPSVVPTIDGRLQLIWYDSGIELEITIDRNGEARASLFDLATNDEYDDLTVADARIAEAIRRLSASL